MRSSKVINKYLLHYAEPEIAGLAGLNAYLPVNHVWSDVVVIPACNENSDLLRAPPPSEGRSLMILVINQTAIASAAVAQANQALFTAATEQFDMVWSSVSFETGQGDREQHNQRQYHRRLEDQGQVGTGSVNSGHQQPCYALILLKDRHADRDILLVDKFSAGHQLPPRGGVGNARKIGADLATGLIQAGRITSQWIRCTDADVVMPATYFTCTRHYAGVKGVSALIYPFQHGEKNTVMGPASRSGSGSDSETGTESRLANHHSDVVLATRLYELSLHYYVAAFKSVGSPYAFHTIGSTIAIDVDHYAKVRGFPKREAGEDFYLLNKLAKSGEVLQMELSESCHPMEIEARLSDRVPFGTGAAVGKMTALNDVVNDYRFYDPRLFGLLGAWLKSWPAIWDAQSCELSASIFTGHSVSELLVGQPKNHEWQCLLDNLRVLKINTALEHAFRQSKTFDQFVRQMNIWFDAFRSLKLLHALRDQLLPSISFEELSGRAEYHFLLSRDADLNECQSRL